MKKVFIVHGFNGEPNGGWRPWLMAELAQHEIYACALPMPTPDAPQKDEWVETIARAAAGNAPEDVFLVGHSLGVPAILRYLETVTSPIGGAVLVSGPVSKLKEEDPTARLRKIDNFFETPFDFESLKTKAKTFAVVHGSNDERVPVEHARILSTTLNCPLSIVEGGGHLNGKSGWYKLPESLEFLLGMLRI